MSFLNPVNEPVLRFSSTDASAPRINYNARTAGDVIAVLKACLVTGYGTKPSAGWSVVNEVGNVAEFVSPSAARGDYRLGIDDTSAIKYQWHYSHGTNKTLPISNFIVKTPSNINAAHATNGWELLVTQQGFYFIEVFYISAISDRLARLTYFGAAKTVENLTYNMCFWCVGWGQPAGTSSTFFNPAYTRMYTHYSIGATPEPYDKTSFGATGINAVGSENALLARSAQVLSPVYLYNNQYLFGSQPGLHITAEMGDDVYGVFERDLGYTRNALEVSVCSETSTEARKLTRKVVIPLDYWEY